MRLSISTTVAASLIHWSDTSSNNFCHAFQPVSTPITAKDASPFTTQTTTTCLQATIDNDTSSSSTNAAESFAKSIILENMSSGVDASKEYAEMFGLGETDAGLYAFFDAIRQSDIALGLKGQPFVLRKDEITKALDGNNAFEGFFNMDDLEKALQDDFLDAARGSTDNRKGWQISAVSTPRGESFEEARMTYEDVLAALEKGTVIFNAAGAHIPKLAGPCLAVSDATYTPNAVNLYVTSSGKRTSAPPHTDKQDVVVVQSTGCKHWRVYAPTDASVKPNADIFARGKGDDNLPLYNLEEQGNLLIETVLNPGDILFIPAAFPHTTSTAVDASDSDETSLHMTFNIDTHVWDLDYLSARRLALRRGCVQDTALGQSREEDNRYVGRVNELPKEAHEDIMTEFPLGFLSDEPPEHGTVDSVCEELMRISKALDEETFSKVDQSIWKETVERIREQGVELYDIHRDMYLSAIEEGRKRENEDAMTAHLDKSKPRTLTPERMQRLSVFRVQKHYEKVNQCKASLAEWSYSGKAGASGASETLPENWAFTMPVKVGDQVEGNLGGAFFPATVTRIAGNKFDVRYFDGDQDTGLDRSMIKLLAPPNLVDDDVDTSNMTPKQLKRWKKQQAKKSK